MRDVRDQYLPPDHDAFVGAEPPTGRVIVIAPTRAACETIELAVGTPHRDVPREALRPARARAGARSPRLRHRRRHGLGQDARDPPDRRRAARHHRPSRRRDQPRARGDAGDAELERHHRHDRHRAALVPGRRHSAERHARRRRDSSDVGRARALPRAGQARRLPVHLAVRHRRSDVLSPSISRARTCSRCTRSIRTRRRRWKW